MHNYLATAPFDLYELHLFHSIAQYRNFTRAGQAVGLTQSAITRQIQGMEDRLGVRLFERTTRHVRLTPAGDLLFKRSESILNEVSSALIHIRQDFDLIPKTIRLGVSRSVSLAYLPGFFVRFQRRFPSVQFQIAHEESRAILDALEDKKLDIGIISPPSRLPRGVQVIDSFEDGFALITPPNVHPSIDKLSPKHLLKRFGDQRWLLIDRRSNTGEQLFDWMENFGLEIEPAMEMDNFDLIINLVGLGMGVSIVPNRSLALYLRKRNIRKIQLSPTFKRRIVVLTRKDRNPPAHIQQFVESILF